MDNQHRAASSAASSESNMETVRLLLDTGPNAEAQMWQTAKVAQLRPRHVPGVLQAGHAKIVRLLLEARANKGVADKTGRTELITAGVKGHVGISRLLRQAAARMWHSAFTWLVRLLLEAGT